jgi:hypothetical protein
MVGSMIHFREEISPLNFLGVPRIWPLPGAIQYACMVMMASSLGYAVGGWIGLRIRARGLRLGQEALAS